ncbi:MAG TPA: DNA polymerase III subunit delta' [Paenibacillaceae bacterium]
MAIRDMPGQPAAKALLAHALRTGKVAHAYLFAGPPGTGRRAMALAFAQALFCEKGGDDACGECLACRKVQSGNHPDLRVIAPEGASLKLGQILQLQRDMSYRGMESARKAAILERAETMTPEAANSLLKFLEEPPPGLVAILIAPGPKALPPTVVSRMQVVPFSPADPAELEEALAAEGHPRMLARLAAHLAPGLDGCRELLSDKGFAELRNLVIQLGEESVSRLPDVLLAAHRAFRTDLAGRAELLLGMLALWYRDIVLAGAGRGDRLVFADRAQRIAELARRRGAVEWIRAAEQALAAVRRIRANVSPQLALEHFLIRTREG